MSALVLREMRLAARSFSLPMLLALYPAILGGLALVYLFQPESARVEIGPRLNVHLFTVLATAQVYLAAVTMPWLAVSTARGDDTPLYLLWISRVRPMSLVLARLWASLGGQLLCVVASLPAWSVLLLVGGAPLRAVIMAQVIPLALALAFSGLGLLVRSIGLRGAASAAAVYLLALLAVAGPSLGEWALDQRTPVPQWARHLRLVSHQHVVAEGLGLPVGTTLSLAPAVARTAEAQNPTGSPGSGGGFGATGLTGAGGAAGGSGPTINAGGVYVTTPGKMTLLMVTRGAATRTEPRSFLDRLPAWVGFLAAFGALGILAALGAGIALSWRQ